MKNVLKIAAHCVHGVIGGLQGLTQRNKLQNGNVKWSGVMDAIRLENLSKFYRSGFWMRRFEAVRDISISVPKGEAFGFVHLTLVTM